MDTTQITATEWTAAGAMITLVATVLLPSMRQTICAIIHEWKNPVENGDDNVEKK